MASQDSVHIQPGLQLSAHHPPCQLGVRELLVRVLEEIEEAHVEQERDSDNHRIYLLCSRHRGLGQPRQIPLGCWRVDLYPYRFHFADSIPLQGLRQDKVRTIFRPGSDLSIARHSGLVHILRVLHLE